jgi:hypothetical protein
MMFGEKPDQMIVCDALQRCTGQTDEVIGHIHMLHIALNTLAARAGLGWSVPVSTSYVNISTVLGYIEIVRVALSQMPISDPAYATMTKIAAYRDTDIARGELIGELLLEWDDTTKLLAVLYKYVPTSSWLSRNWKWMLAAALGVAGVTVGVIIYRRRKST